jgi:hypothetical protein
MKSKAVTADLIAESEIGQSEIRELKPKPK